MARVFIIILFFSVVIAQKNSLNSSTATKLLTEATDLDPAEIERQNRITQQIFANYIERRLFPHRKAQQKVPTIEEILPPSITQSPKRLNQRPTRRNHLKNLRRPKNDEPAAHDEPAEVFDDKGGDEEALQSVESKQHDQYYDEFGTDPSENEIRGDDCPNCVDETQYSNKWTMPLLKLGEKRYYLGIFFKANWFKAAQYCRYHGMHLSSISSQEENDRLEKYIRDFGLGHEHFWTSGTDLADEGNFFWMANGRPITFTNWNAGEPNNFRYENGEEENCLELWNRDGKGLKWNDSPCSFETYFVCEVQSQ
ncbi:uncharacterized protein LOC129608924 [Condylostylus longicornis]|uniref:uncharacterized protein LOC129608924 n=1 Tax=Condylostylus longicornis TaxID=2530218 RepID=UPI00244DA700|nr:uncharacterized protein LOC129608924 [Condylostylus longicornis]